MTRFVPFPSNWPSNKRPTYL